MAKTEEIPASNDTLLALIASLQGLTLVLQANLGAAAAAQPAIPTPPPTAPYASSSGSNPPAAISPASAGPTVPPTAAIPAATMLNVAVPIPPPVAAPIPPPVTAPTAPPVAVPTAPPIVATATTTATVPPAAAAAATPGTLAAIYLTPLALSSRGVHPTVLGALPDILNAPESGSWFVVTVGQYTGIYLEWLQVGPLVTGWSNACCKRYPTKTAALAAYDLAWRGGIVRGGIHPDHEL